ncbi:MAG TPA: acetate--CoA ligase family protein [Conexibacter sp.]|nr:acetate--CoA ligase family protein [Conexibacter sp.]
MRIPPSTAAVAAREVDVVLRNGAPVHVRPVHADDLPVLRAFLDRHSSASRRPRWFAGAAGAEAAARWAADVDRHERDGLIATIGADAAADEIVGHAAWARIGGERAGVAFATADTPEGRGLATILLAQLAFGARARGIATFVAEVPPEDHALLSAFRDSGLPLHVRAGAGVLQVEMPTAPTERAREHFERRDSIAAVAAMDSVLRPRSLAVVGASPDPGTIGGAVFRALVDGGYAGALYAVNRHQRNLLGHHCFASIDAIPDEIEAVVLAIPAAQRAPVALACAAHAVRALIVLAGGPAETEPAGLASRRELLAICRTGRMRLLGPSCLGCINADPAVRLDASLAATTPSRGHLAVLSRSGGAGIALLQRVQALGIGLSAFVSVGEQADLSGDAFLEWCEQDERTRAIVLGSESFGNARTFARIARRVGRVKPILTLKPKRLAPGARAAASRTGALLASSETTAAALFRQAGMLPADTPGELLDLAALLERHPLPRGPRVAIVTNAHTAARRAADAFAAEGLEPTVELLTTATPEAFQAAIEAIGASGTVDAIVAVVATEAEDVTAALREAGRTLAGRLPLLSLPACPQPQSAARALGRAVAHARWRAAPRGAVPTFEDVRPDEAAAIVARALGTSAAAAGCGAAAGTWLEPHEVRSLLACYGVASKAIAPAPPTGRALFVGATCDSLLGPVVACCAGESAPGPPHAIAARLTPLTERDARELVASLSLASRSHGAAGAPPAGLPALEQLLLRISALVDAHPEIAELECDPVIAHPGGTVVVAARVRATADA